MADKTKKNFGRTRSILTPSSNSSSAISGGINDFMVNSFKEKESGIANVLGAIVGASNVDKFENLKSNISLEDTIFAPKFGSQLLSYIKNIDSKLLYANSYISQISTALNELVNIFALALMPKDTEGNVLNIVLDTSKANNLENIISYVKDLSDEESLDNLKFLTKIEKFFTELNKLTDADGIITTAINNTNNIPPLTKQAKKNMNALTAFITSISSINVPDLKGLKNSVQIITDLIKDIDKSFSRIENIDISDKVANIRHKLEEIRKLYDEDIVITANAISNHDKDLELIKEKSNNAVDVATSVSKVDEKTITESKENVAEIIDAISMMSIMMLIGGYFIYKNPHLIKGSLLFGATLSVFLLELMIPIALMSKIASRKETKADIGKIVGLITGLSILMIIGAFIVNAVDIVEGALKFGVVLTAFLTMLMIPIGLLALFSGKETFNNLDNVNKVVIMSAIIMMIGSFIIESINVKNALKFGIVLGLFIAAVLAPFMIYGLFVRKATDISRSVMGLVITCTILMMVGAFVVQNATFVKNALTFGIILGTFILLTLAPMLLFAVFKEHVAKTVSRVLWYITVSTLIMLIGAKLSSNHAFVKNALTFGVILMAFITMTLLPIVLFSLFVKKLTVTLIQVIAFITVCTFIMMVGALFIADRRLVIGALAFGLLLGVFISMIVFPFILLKPAIALALPSLIGLSLFVLSCGIMLALTTLIVDKYGWKALWAVGLLDLFIGSIVLMINHLNMKLRRNQVINAAILMGTVAGFMLITVGTLLLLKFVKWWSIVKLGILIACISIMLLAIKEITNGLRKSEVENALALMIGVSAILLVTTGILLLLKFVDGWSILKLSIILTCIGIMLSVVKNISKSLRKSEVENALALMVGISAILLITTGILLLLKFVNRNAIGKLIIVEALTLGFIALVKVIVKGLTKTQVTNAVSLMLGISTLLGVTIVSLLLLNFVKTESIAKLALVELCIGGLIFLVKKVSKGLKLNESINASLIMLSVSATLVIMTGALLLLNFVKTDSIGKLALLELCIGGMILLVNIVSTALTIDKAINASLIMLGISATLVIASGALLLLNFVKKDSIGKLALLELCIVGMIGIALIAGIPVLVPIITTGIVVIGLITALIAGISVAFMLMSTAILLAEKIKNTDAIKNAVKAFVDAIANIPLNPAKLALLVAKGVMISALILSITPALALMAITVSSLANLRVATEWNQDGKPIKYRQLNTSDFANAANAISTLLTTLISGISLASEKIKRVKLNTLLKTIYLSHELGSIIGNIAEGIKSYAQLMIPDRWNENGKPVHYHLMRREEFTDAAHNISTIILTVGGAIANIATSNDPIARDFMEAISGGDRWWERPNKFSKILNASSKLGELISSIAQGVGSFAKMMVPDRWNEEGKPIHYKQLSQNDIDLAVNNIGKIILATAQPIIDIAADSKYSSLFEDVIVSGGWFGKKKTEPSKFTKVLSGSIQLGDIIANIAKGVQEMANLRFITKYDDKGNPIEWIRLTDNDFIKISENIHKVLTATIQGISDAVPDAKKADEIKNILDAIIPVGDIISNIAKGISGMADLKFATEYDANGKPIKWAKLTEEDFVNAGNNVARVVTSTIQSLLAGYEEYNKYNPAQLKEILEAMKPVTDILSVVGNSIVNLAGGKVTINGKEKLIDLAMIKHANENVKELLTATISNLISIYESNKTYFAEGDSSIVNIVDNMSNVFTLISSYAETIKKFNELENVDKALQNINKLINNESGIIKMTLNGFSGITSDNINDLSVYIKFIEYSIPLFEELTKYSALISENKKMISLVASYASSNSQHGNYGIFSDIMFIIKGIINTTDISLNYEAINTALNNMANINGYMMFYADILEYIVNNIYPLFGEIETIYNMYFSTDNLISDKVNAIISGIRSTISILSPIDNNRSGFNKFFNIDGREIKRNLRNFKEEVTLYVEILNLINKIPVINVSIESLNNAGLNLLFNTNEPDSLYTTLLNFTKFGDISYHSLRNGYKNLNTFNDIVLKLIEISSHVNGENIILDSYENINLAIDEINKSVNKTGEIKKSSLDNFDKETNTLSRFVQAVDKIDVSKVTKLNDLMSTMSELASKMGGFNELIKLIDGDLVDVLDKLSEKIEDAKKTISTAERIESERQRKFQNNMDNLKKLIENPISVKVGNLKDDNSITAGFEKTK